ncbi:DUF6555 family protein [Pseudomonas massiliensis]|uniref:DUF6555 family protein n=1 Tax=Pseudomonas massiliensis TaxID=522492 RepID=UPI00058C4301|nr:DUF6555 family protein [Pseudomonas massiliensis]
MERRKQYMIRYRYKGQTRAFTQADSRMTKADAWYYASLHCGAVQLYGVTALGGDTQALRRRAEGCGLSDVDFRELS